MSVSDRVGVKVRGRISVPVCSWCFAVQRPLQRVKVRVCVRVRVRVQG